MIALHVLMKKLDKSAYGRVENFNLWHVIFVLTLISMPMKKGHHPN